MVIRSAIRPAIRAPLRNPLESKWGADSNGLSVSAPSSIIFADGDQPFSLDGVNAISFADTLADTAATNLVTDPEDFSAASWSKTSATITTDAATAPNGATTADKFAGDGTAGLVQMFDSISTTISGDYVFSLHVKAAELRWVLLWNSQLSNSAVWFDVLTGQVGTKQANAGDVGIVPAGEGYYRIWHKQTATTTGGQFRVAISTADGNASPTITAGHGVYVWGAFVEQGSALSTYYRDSYTLTLDIEASGTIDFDDTAYAAVTENSGADASGAIDVTGTLAQINALFADPEPVLDNWSSETLNASMTITHDASGRTASKTISVTSEAASSGSPIGLLLALTKAA